MFICGREFPQIIHSTVQMYAGLDQSELSFEMRSSVSALPLC